MTGLSFWETRHLRLVLEKIQLNEYRVRASGTKSYRRSPGKASDPWAPSSDRKLLALWRMNLPLSDPHIYLGSYNGAMSYRRRSYSLDGGEYDGKHEQAKFCSNRQIGASSNFFV
jgi:hypothetical protein